MGFEKSPEVEFGCKISIFLPSFDLDIKKSGKEDRVHGKMRYKWKVQHLSFPKQSNSKSTSKNFFQKVKICAGDWKSLKFSNKCQKKERAKISPKSKK